MPAITVEDVLVLSHLPTPAPAGTRVREVRRLVTAPRGYEGEGFPVRRGFADVPLSELAPFVHFDHLDEVDLGPGEPKGAPWHPHRGFVDRAEGELEVAERQDGRLDPVPVHERQVRIQRPGTHVGQSVGEAAVALQVVVVHAGK
ncbi:hypothetical protein [Streptomyces cahuitamycinicus]|uniref:hypothetical protein n=1 Tax=Streptomyces cahuitamycinicus TaxID=2070367 RepID=UPI000D1CFC83|nr:hypothetical protein [Streptomyces cahuitamycinicus]